MMQNHKTKYYTYWIITILLSLFYLFDRSQVKKIINGYELDIALVEEELISNNVLTDNINDSKNYYESVMDTIESYSITDNRLMNEINRLRILANELNISISKVEVDPQNSFPGKFRTNLKINTELERQTLVLDLKGRFLRVGKFLENYEKINAPLKLQSCDISLDTLDPIGVTAQLRFVMYTGIKS